MYPYFDTVEFPEDSPLMKLKMAYFKAIPEVCVERPRLVTRFHRELGLFDQDSISNLDKARVYRNTLRERTPVVWHTVAYTKDAKDYAEPQPFTIEDHSPFAGSTTSKFKGVLIHPELMGLVLWPELLSMAKRKQNPFQITTEDIRELNLEIFPPWMNRTVLEIARERSYALTPGAHRSTSRELRLMQQIVFYLTSKVLCISHTIPDFSKAVNIGLSKMIEEAQQRKAASSDESKKEFYAAKSEVLEGIIEYSNNLAKKAESMAAKESLPEKQDLLREIAERYRRVPEHPAQSFKDALTTVWIVWTALHLENANVGLSLGRLDQLLYPFYREDVDNNKLKPEEALELICYLWLKIGDHVPIMTEAAEQLFGGTGSNQAITVGGIDKSGKDAVNDLTYLILRATEIMKLRDPNLNARYHPEKNSRDYLRRICEVNVNTRATPAIHNDPSVIKALKSKGDSEEQANDYGIVGCVEPVSAGRAYQHCAAVLINLPSVLDLTLYNGRHRHTGDELISMETGNVKQFNTFGQFLDAFAAQTHWIIDRATALNDLLGRVHQDFYPTPILSSFFEGPMDKGKDLIQGGATINASGATIIGLADTADSLSAIEELCFPAYDLTKTPISTMIEAIESDFANHDVLHKKIMKTGKYGNDDPGADSHVNWLVKLLDDAFKSKTNYRGGGYRVGYWTMTIHAGMSKVTGATPNGRRKGKNFASGITPVSGVTPYLTSALNSVAQLPGRCASSGMALNIKLTPEADRERMLDILASLVRGYFDKANTGNGGGLEIQFNIVDREILENAANHPEVYPDLLVRVSGYTAYFKDLGEQMQREIIERSEYLLSPGQAHPFEPFDLGS
jgi:pyruvate formate-lyase/glycerol dehydratase family glycyl radical enzyme